MADMGKRPRKLEDGFTAPKGWKPLTVFLLFAALLALGCALKPALTAENGVAVASGMTMEPGRNILYGLAALGMMALGAVMARLLGGCLPKDGCGVSRNEFGFLRHSSDRPPLGRASGRRGGKA